MLAIDRPPNNSYIPVLKQFGYSPTCAPLLGGLLGAPLEAARIVRARSKSHSNAERFHAFVGARLRPTGMWGVPLASRSERGRATEISTAP